MKYFTFLAIFLSSCLSVPKQAPDLSETLGKEISILEKSHLSLLRAYFDELRVDMDEYIQSTWLPRFAQNFFSDPDIQDAWNEIVSADDRQERLDFILAVAPELQSTINEKRLELMSPLDDLERAIESSLREQYTHTRSINNALTSFLASAAQVRESQQRYLDMVKITDDKIGRAIDRTDEVLDDLLKKSKQVTDAEEKVAEYRKKLKEVKDELSK